MRRPSGAWPSVRGLVSETMQEASSWGQESQGDEGREGWGRESCNKGPGLFQGKKGAAGQEGGHYKKDELRLEPQRHSVSQAATTA